MSEISFMCTSGGIRHLIRITACFLSPVKLSGLVMMLFMTQASFAQKTISGNITDESGKAIPYVRLGIIGSSVQTMSDESGVFELKLSTSALSKNITFQAPGYETRGIAASELEGPDQAVVLNELVTRLKDVEVLNKRKVKKKVLGNRGIVSGYRRKSINAQYLVAVNNKGDNPAIISKIWIHINQPEQTEFVLRPLIFSVDQSRGQPLNNLVSQNITFNFSDKKGWVCMDLSSLLIDAPDGTFFVGAEWVGNQKTQYQSSISLLMTGSADSYESTQMGEWLQIKGQGAFAIKTQLRYY